MTRWHRLSWVEFEGWRAGTIGPSDPWGPLAVPVRRQGGPDGGRADNPNEYGALYIADNRITAAVEVVSGRFPGIDAPWLQHNEHDDVVRCWVRIEVDGPLVDFDDPVVLEERNRRPSQVITRNRRITQQIALREWHARADTGARGITWWSYHDPDWSAGMVWSDRLVPGADPQVEFDHVDVLDVEPLRIDDPDLLTAADVAGFDVRARGHRLL